MFTYDLATDIGKVRLLINDTIALTAHFTDEEIQAFLTMGGSVLKAAAMALRSWAASLTGTEDSERIGDYAYTKKQVANMLELADKYEKQEAEMPAFAWSEMNFTDVEEDEDI